jgi:flagellar basal-body rod protein FlgF
VFLGHEGELLITRDGSILVNGELVDRLAVVELPPAAAPVKAGENLFTAAAGAAVPAADFTVWSGFLEGSNVDLSREMVNLVEVRRTYESAQKVMQTYNSLLSIGANELGVLG